jgi:outer membrane lipase/esterase
MFTSGKLNEGNSSAGVQPGYDFTTGGITAGADYRVNDHLVAGMSGGYLHGQASIAQPTAGTVSNQSGRYGIYATAFTDNFHANIYLGGAVDFFITNRNINFASITRTATASPRGNEINIDPSLSYDIRVKDWAIFTPFAGLDYDRLMVNSFTETGAGALNLSVGPQTAKTLESSLGLRFSEKLPVEAGTIIPFASLGWRHEFENQSRPIDAQLASAGGSQFSIRTGNFAQDGTLVGAGISGTWHDDVLTKLEYSGDFRSHYHDHIVDANLRWKF